MQREIKESGREEGENTSRRKGFVKIAGEQERGFCWITKMWQGAVGICRRGYNSGDQKEYQN